MIALGLHVGDAMTYELFEQFGFDRTAIEDRLNLLGLGGPAILMIAEELQSHVIQPNVDSIIEDFYEALERTSEFQSLVLEQGQINHLKMTQRKYLLSLGQDFVGQRRFFDLPDDGAHQIRNAFQIHLVQRLVLEHRIPAVTQLAAGAIE